MTRKLDDGQVDEIRRAWGGGAKAPELAERFGIAPSHVWRLCEPKLYGRPDPKREAAAARKRAAAARRGARTRKAAKVPRRDEEVRRLWSEGWLGRELAERFGIARSKVSAIVAGMPRPRRVSGPEGDRPAVMPAPAPAPSPPDDPGRPPVPVEPPDPADRLIRGPTVWGSAHGQAKLDEEKVAELRRLRSQGWRTPALAARYGVGRNTVCYALSGRTWSHVPGAIPAKGGG